LPPSTIQARCGVPHAPQTTDPKYGSGGCGTWNGGVRPASTAACNSSTNGTLGFPNTGMTSYTNICDHRTAGNRGWARHAQHITWTPPAPLTNGILRTAVSASLRTPAYLAIRISVNGGRESCLVALVEQRSNLLLTHEEVLRQKGPYCMQERRPSYSLSVTVLHPSSWYSTAAGLATEGQGSRSKQQAPGGIGDKSWDSHLVPHKRC
jgi:hypothetical protein